MHLPRLAVEILNTERQCLPGRMTTLLCTVPAQALSRVETLSGSCRTLALVYLPPLLLSRLLVYVLSPTNLLPGGTRSLNPGVPPQLHALPAVPVSAARSRACVLCLLCNRPSTEITHLRPPPPPLSSKGFRGSHVHVSALPQTDKLEAVLGESWQGRAP